MDQPADNATRQRTLVYGVLAALLVLAAFAWRIQGISQESLWHDEATSVLYLDVPTLGDYFKTQTGIDPAIVPLYFVIEYYTARATGHSILALRAVSLAFGMATLLLLYAFGRRLFGPTGGLLALLFGAFSKTMMYQSQEIRMYALTYLLALAAMYTFYLAYTERKPAWWILNVLLNCALFFTHLLALSVVLAQGVAFLVLQRQRIVPVVLWSLAHLPGLIPLALWIRSIDNSAVDRHLSWILPPGFGQLIGCYMYCFPGVKFHPGDLVRHQPLGIPYLHIWGAAFLLACIVFIVRRKSVAIRHEAGSAQTYDRPAAIILISWLVVPVAAVVVLSYLVRPCFSDRYLGYQAFPMFLMMAGCVSALKTPTRRILASALFVFLAACNAFSVERPLRVNSAAAVKYLESRVAPDDTIMLAGKRCVPPFTYYTKLDPKRLVMTIDYQKEVIDAVEAGKLVWFVVPNVSSPSIRIYARDVDKLLEGRPYEIERIDFPGFVPLQIYRIKKPS